jgi:hypothetical protein
MTISSKIRRTTAVVAGFQALSLSARMATSSARAQATTPASAASHAIIHTTRGVSPDSNLYCESIQGIYTCGIWGGYELQPGDYIGPVCGPSICTTLIMQTDGNLVLYHNCNGSYHAVWGSGTRPTGDYASMQGDGNLVVYDDFGQGIWSTRTNGNDNAWLAIQGDGNLVVYQAPPLFPGTALWASNTNHC